MGYEAYKITAKFQNLTAEDMISTLRDEGAALTEQFGDTATMEIADQHGVIDLVLREANQVNLRFSPGPKVFLTLRFAKVSEPLVSGSVTALLKRLAAKLDVVYIRDCESGRDMTLDNTSGLLKAVTYAKYDFEYHYPVSRHHVRCRDVFCLCGYDYPTAPVDELR